MSSRRDALKGIAAVASLGVFLAGYYPTIEQIFKPKRHLYLPDPQKGDNVRYVRSVCLGCNVRCGITARVVNYNGVEVIDRIEGNPYHPYNRAVSYDRQVRRYTQLDYGTPAEAALDKWHGTLCARGQDGIHYVYDPYRVVKPLKRAGPRGSGKWKVISWEQLIKEVVEGGVIEETGERLPGLKDFFVYGKLKKAGVEDPNAILSEIKKDVVEGIMSKAKDKNVSYEELIAAIGEFKSKWSSRLAQFGLRLEDILINPDMPDLGFLANKIVFIRGRGQGHADYFYKRWVYALGSVNMLRHTSSCQLGYYAGNKLWAGYHDINADITSAKVVIMAGVTMGRQHPGTTGQGLLVERAVEGDVKVYYVNPTAPRTMGTRGTMKWVPIKPGEDGALAMGMIRWIIENNRFDREFFSITNSEAAKRIRGYPIHTNATWLVIFEKGHPRFGEFVKALDLRLEESDKPVVSVNGSLTPYDAVEKADIEFSGRIKLASGDEVLVKTPFTILKEEALSKALDEWASICGVPAETIVEMARDFTDAAPQASTYIHRGVGMHPNGEYSIWAFRTLDILVGNLNKKGGLMARASHTKYNDYLYNTGYKKHFGEPPHLGPPIDRHKYAYENTLEYWLKVKRGENPYPAKRPWYPLTPEESYTEFFAGASENYPYSIGALIMYYANPVLSANYGLKFIEVLKSTEKIPLFIAITTTINETFMYADYIVPDTTYLETGTLGMQYLYATSWGGTLNEGWRSPVILPLTEHIGRCPNGHDRWASMWEFLIDVAKTLGAPGYGEKSIPGVAKKYKGQWFQLHCLWEYIMRVYANGALDAKDRGLIPEDVPTSDIAFVERNYPIARFKDILPEDEWRYVAYSLARGGVFTKYEESFDERGFSKRKPFGDGIARLWNEKLAKVRNSVTGEKFYGGPKYIPPATYAPVAGRGGVSPAGTPLREVWPAGEWPLTLVYLSGPLMTKHRSQFYYWIRQVLPENFVLVNPRDAEKVGIKNMEVIRVETPYGVIEATAVVEPTVAEGVVAIPYGLGRWSETVIHKPNYIKAIKDPEVKRLIEEIPEKTEIPADAVNPLKQLPDLVKQLLFTKSPADYYTTGLEQDEWRFNGVTPNPVQIADPSLGDWPLLSWIGAAQAYFITPVKIRPTGREKKLKVPQVIW